MPRGPRLDAPGVLHHVMVRGIDGTLVFRTDTDREDFLRRLAGAVEAGGTQVLAWALIPNHLHLLLRTGWRPLPSLMRQVLTGYAGSFNRRHRRRGHLFQNRYKSIVVEEEPYLLELTRYIHLNPLRAGVVDTLDTLDQYPWAGHSALMGHIPRPWQAVDVILTLFAPRLRGARTRYRAFLAEGVPQGHRPELQGGGLRRSLTGWEPQTSLPRGREAWAFDERVLGSGTFVEQILREVAPRPHPHLRGAAGRCLPLLVERIARAFGVSAAEIIGGSRRRPASQARAAVSAVAIATLGFPASRVAAHLGVTLMAVLRGIPRGRAHLAARHLDLDRVATAVLQNIE